MSLKKLKAYCTNDLSKYFIKTIKWKHSPKAHYAKELRVPQKRASVSRKVQWFELVIQLIMNPLQLLYHYRFTKRTCRLCKAALGPSRSIIIIYTVFVLSFLLLLLRKKQYCFNLNGFLNNRYMYQSIIIYLWKYVLRKRTDNMRNLILVVIWFKRWLTKKKHF